VMAAKIISYTKCFQVKLLIKRDTDTVMVYINCDF